ncbi:probable purine permease 11 [Aristolochia californica]|uniref:probable purine permease 11 n=1 Tax=Aristolochia californica TaxID=171875 RepID=UPI0035DE32AF
MGEVQELQLHTTDVQEPSSPKDVTVVHSSPSLPTKGWKWWVLVGLNITFLVSGQSIGNLLGRFYFDKGGNSIWMATLVQSAGFPILLLPLLVFPSRPFRSTKSPSIPTLAFIYIFLGLLIAGDNTLYSYGLLYLPVSTYSIICATQLGFNVIFSYFLNSQKFTHLILNSVVLLTLSATLLAAHSESSPSGVSSRKYALGIVFTVAASATYSLILSLIQLSFQKVIKDESFSIVFRMQFYSSFVTSSACVVGLFASGEWRSLKGEMERFETGKVSYVMTLVWTALGWQLCSIGTFGLIFQVSSLFTNVIGTLALPVVPILAVIFFEDKMDGVKVMALLMALWGFASYIYQNYLDDYRSKRGSDICSENPIKPE